MAGGPCKIHMKADAEPHAVHAPIPTPYHMKKQFDDLIDKEVETGILKQAGANKPTPYCAQMVPVVTKTKKPRKTKNYRHLNQQVEGIPHHTPRPFDVVSNIPSKTYKTVMDAYSGFNQIALDEDSVELTTFICEKGRFQSLRAPQGFIGSGDMYTRRYDDIIACLLYTSPSPRDS